MPSIDSMNPVMNTEDVARAPPPAPSLPEKQTLNMVSKQTIGNSSKILTSAALFVQILSATAHHGHEL